MTNENKAKKNYRATETVTPEFRVSFANMFQAKAAPGSDKPKFGLVMLFDVNPTSERKVDLTPLKAIVRAAIEERWGKDQSQWPKNLVLPFRDGKEKDYEGYGPGVIFASASAWPEHKPYLVDEDVQPIMTADGFKSGDYAHAKVNAFAWPAKGKQGFGKCGVSFGLIGVQKTRDGEPFSGKSKPENDFDAIPVEGGGAGAAASSDGAVDNGLGI